MAIFKNVIKTVFPLSLAITSSSNQIFLLNKDASNKLKVNEFTIDLITY